MKLISMRGDLYGNKKKRLFSVLALTAGLLLSITGCGAKAAQEQVSEVAAEFLKASDMQGFMKSENLWSLKVIRPFSWMMVIPFKERQWEL